MKKIVVLMMLALLTAIVSPAAYAEEQQDFPQVNWIEGGTMVEIGEISELALDQSLLFLDKEDNRKIQEYFGNFTSDTEMGSVFPADENQNWFVLFSYEETGHIMDDDKDKIDPAQLLESFREGTEQENLDRPEEERLYVKGWHTEPFYDDKKRVLVWALAAEDALGNPIINYNVRTLTREGYVSTLLVTDPGTLDRDIAFLSEKILPNYVIKGGFRYEDFDQTADKVAEYGLTGLILGGAGLAIAKKTGILIVLLALLKKFWFVLLAFLAPLWGWLKNRRSKSQHHTDSSSETPNQEA